MRRISVRVHFTESYSFLPLKIKSKYALFTRYFRARVHSEFIFVMPFKLQRKSSFSIYRIINYDPRLYRSPGEHHFLWTVTESIF